ncbi:MAG: STAS domain-containing protein, partial [Sphingomicrobium sp.]
MATAAKDDGQEQRDDLYRCVGALTIARAASTDREIADMPDGMTIDLSEVERMDTVGAWLIHRAERDRGAKVSGASEEFRHLINQVGESDEPIKVVPEK